MTPALAYAAGFLTCLLLLSVAVLVGAFLRDVAKSFDDGAELPVPPWKAIGRLAQDNPPLRGHVKPDGRAR